LEAVVPLAVALATAADILEAAEAEYSPPLKDALVFAGHWDLTFHETVASLPAFSVADSSAAAEGDRTHAFRGRLVAFIPSGSGLSISLEPVAAPAANSVDWPVGWARTARAVPAGRIPS
jgi:hypothetical protein